MTAAVDIMTPSSLATRESARFAFYGYFGYAYFGRRCPLFGES